MKVLSPQTLELDLSVPDPYLPFYLSQDSVTGDVISPAALKDPSALGTSTDGTGPYVLDAATTVTGSKYVYVPNANYWNPSAIHWNKVVIEVITSATATLDALQTGAADYAAGTAVNAQTAKQDGLNVSAAPLNWASLLILDHNGQVTPALKSVKVRQALNWAINRPAIAKALWGQFGGPLDETIPPGQTGYNKGEANMYGYNIAKAKKLLAEGGYPNGFTLPVLAYNLQGKETTLAQAVASYLAKIEDPRRRALIYFASATRRQFYFDGNKRTARLMMTGELMSSGYDIVSVPFGRKLEFNNALDTLFSEDDGTELLHFLATCTLT
jgi:peptide/nickel transport system substrate-binding protein